MKKRRYFGYILYCDGCVADIQHESFKEGPCGAMMTVTSDPVYSTADAALEAGLEANKAFLEFSYRVFTYEVK